MAPIPYSQLRSQLKTGDILTFSGKSPLDWMIRFVEGEPYTHVGMVIRDGSNLYFWDAPGGGTLFPDPYKGGQSHTGCRVADLDKIMAYYMSPGVELSVYWRQLAPAITPAQQASLLTFVNLADGMPFPGGDINLPDGLGLGFGLASSAAMGNAFHLTVAGYFFCAHLVAQSYMQLGVLPIAPFPANSYSPADFNSTTSKQLPLQAGWSLTPTQQVSYP